VTRFFVRVIPEEASENPDNPWDWASFGWGMLAGSVVTVVIGGIILYLTWPYLLALMRGLVGAEFIRGAELIRGLLE